jgi:1,4-dihydroxy-2-naphthoate octaprenyltransferase
MELNLAILLAGVFVGVLSSLVLFITSFPDFETDKAKGRKTLVIVAGKQNATLVFWIFPVIVYSVLISGVVLEVFPAYSLISFAMIPLIIKVGLQLQKNFNDDKKIIALMSQTISFSRITGALFVLSFLIHL